MYLAPMYLVPVDLPGIFIITNLVKPVLCLSICRQILQNCWPLVLGKDLSTSYPPLYLRNFRNFALLALIGEAEKNFRLLARSKMFYEDIMNQVSLEGRRIGLCGTYMGGGLAMSFVLDKIRSGTPLPISAMAVSDAVFDWTYMATHPVHPRFYPEIVQLSPYFVRVCATLSLVRTFSKMEHVFEAPVNCFSPLASPMLFFRKAGWDVPPTFPHRPLDDLRSLWESWRTGSRLTQGRMVMGSKSGSALRIPAPRVWNGDAKDQNLVHKLLSQRTGRRDGQSDKTWPDETG